MTAKDLERFQVAFAQMGVRLGVSPMDGAIDVWWEDLSRYPIESVETAMQEVAREYTFSTWPPIALVLAKLQDSSEQVLKENAESAWAAALKSIFDYDVELTALAEQAKDEIGRRYGGWGMWDTDRRHFVHTEYVNAYCELAKREDHARMQALATEREVKAILSRATDNPATEEGGGD